MTTTGIWPCFSTDPLTHGIFVLEKILGSSVSAPTSFRRGKGEPERVKNVPKVSQQLWFLIWEQVISQATELIPEQSQKTFKTHAHMHTHVHVHTCTLGHRYADLGTASGIDGASVSSRYCYSWLEVTRLSSSQSRDVNSIMEIHPNPWSDLTHAEPLLQPAGVTRIVVNITRLLGDSCSVKWQEK